MGGLTLTIITAKATSLNYGESVGNVSVLKKLSLGDGSQKTFVSDKALKYDMRRKGKEEKGWRLLDERLKEYVAKNTENSTLDVDSFGEALVKDYEEFDLFGGLFTNLKTDKKVKLSYGDSVKRVCPVKVTYAFSISQFSGDMNFLNNIDAYNRYIKHVEDKPEQAIANSEEHTSHYLYTVTVDLDRVGVWEKEDGTTEDVLDNKEKAKRVLELLEIIKTLNRQIKGRWENLSPVFVVGGVFSVKHPFFMEGVEAVEDRDKLWLNTQRLSESYDYLPEGEEAVVGMLSGVFGNEEDIREALGAGSVAEAFKRLKEQVREYYGVSEV
ncbi:type I-B CRISPR-associated protein Cas7/Cst2/DevR [Hydrogenivirga sp. 128-5-R1-1]|uniref:type I-B CRISPR-associated protein Cas7/Cst2/DevR n=1 Tax=Hydrogenivirga sp. 128-5-R1-1 TaxID=392423 RepID=UPI00015F0CCA|nr:type I-B CRISPR-associated protein Cas7/Cst2/DevR [Hydrogenivirga sp. 128-5-R1-1]EDP75973.1 hypothetical protein HG1285_06590 [Hydrogenivirga sp. 128-5-R1-1]